MSKHHVTLSIPEVSFALSLATQRDACKPNRDDRHSRDYTGFAVHFAGVLGEVCFRKVYGGKINTDILPGGDSHAPDIVLPDGRAVEVKTRTWNKGDVALIFEDGELDSMLHVSLVQLQWPDSGIVWPIWDRDFIVPRLQKSNFSYGDRWAFYPERLLKKAV